MGQLQVVARHTANELSSCYEPVLIPGLLFEVLEFGVMDQGSVNAPPPLDHRDSGVGWSLQATSRKLQAASRKLQA